MGLILMAVVFIIMCKILGDMTPSKDERYRERNSDDDNRPTF